MISFGVFLKLIYKLLNFFIFSSLHYTQDTTHWYFMLHERWIFFETIVTTSLLVSINFIVQQPDLTFSCNLKELMRRLLLKNFHATRRDICVFVVYHKFFLVHIITRLFTLWSAFCCVPSATISFIFIYYRSNILIFNY
jgi:hypothetical protein